MLNISTGHIVSIWGILGIIRCTQEQGSIFVKKIVFLLKKLTHVHEYVMQFNFQRNKHGKISKLFLFCNDFKKKLKINLYDEKKFRIRSNSKYPVVVVLL